MGRLFNAGQVALAAIRRTQAIAPFEASADAYKTGIALNNLDTLLSFMNGTEGLETQKVRAQSLALTTSTSYNLDALLEDDLQFVSSVILYDETTGKETPIEMITEKQYDEITDKTTTGEPDGVYITKDDSPTLYTYPTPTAASLYSLRISGYKYSAEVAGNAAGSHDLNSAWQLFLEYRLAAMIGDGPLMRAPRVDINGWNQEAETARQRLVGYHNRTNRNRPRATKPWGP